MQAFSGNLVSEKEMCLVELLSPCFPTLKSLHKGVTSLNKLETINPCKFFTYKGFVLWVPGGTRTHDIQNHNLTL